MSLTVPSQLVLEVRLGLLTPLMPCPAYRPGNDCSFQVGNWSTVQSSGMSRSQLPELFTSQALYILALQWLYNWLHTVLQNLTLYFCCPGVCSLFSFYLIALPQLGIQLPELSEVISGNSGARPCDTCSSLPCC